MLIISNYYVSKVVVAFRGRPRFLFCPKAMSLADGGGLQDFNLIAIPMTYLHVLFKLVNRIEKGNEPIQKAFEKQIYDIGIDVVNRTSATANKDPKTYIEAIIEIYVRFFKVVKEAFDCEHGYMTALDRACGKFINDNAIVKEAQKSAKSAELLARYCDLILRKGNKIELGDIEEKINEIMIVFNYIQDKDIFQKFYGRLLAKRLVEQLSVSDDCEESLITKLRATCGFEYASKLQRMFQDIRLSTSLIKEYKTIKECKTIEEYKTNGEVDFSVMVLTSNSWPFTTPPIFNLPTELKPALDDFGAFYSKKFSGRQLKCLFQYSKGELQTLYTKPKYILQVSTYQMAVLLLFNEFENMTVQKMLDTTQITPESFAQVLVGLLKSKVLTCAEINPDTLNENLDESGIRPNSIIEISQNFRSNKIKINLIKPIGTSVQNPVDTKSIYKSIIEDRKIVIQAAIVRIMKARKQLKHTLLVQEVIQQLNSRFKPEIPMIKVIGFSLFLIDSTACNINKLDGKKKINVSRIDKIFKTVEVVPLYGDMQIAPFNYIKKSPNFDPSKWPICNDTSTSSMQGNLLMQLPEIREEHERFIADLARYTNEGAIQKVMKRTDQEMKYLYNMALTGLQLLSKWTNSILELYCWKLLHPADYRKGASKYEDDGEEYERATRYNYSSQEKFAMVEILSLIKGLQLQMNRLNETFYEAICSTAYIELQTFVQIHIRDMIKKVTQKKRDLTKSILIAVRDTCVDWFNGAGEAGSIEEALALGLKLSQNHGSKKDHIESNHVRFNKRCVGPSSTQLYMVRTMIESLLTDKSGYGKRTLRKDIDYNHLSMIEQFHKQSFFWDYLLNFDATLKQCGDLSQLWYREFYLELTMGRKIQFPIEMSMPWILADHILESIKQPMIEYVFYPMDLYNDAAMHALLVFRKQFLYDEIEAEVNLCFDQLVFKLSDKIFTHFKCLASCMLLDKRYRSECHMNGIKVVFPSANRYDSLLKQRHIQLLGRSIDLTFLLTQRLTLSFKKSLETAIQRFESVNITGVMELQCLLEVNRLTHELLSSYLTLDSFESIISEVNHSVSSALGRITLHIFWELTYDFLPHYCYNGSTNRFVKTQQPHVNETRREKMTREIPDVQLYGTRELNQAYDIVINLYRGFVGVQHFRTMTRLLGYQGIAVVIQEMLKVVKNLLDKTIREFVEKLRTCMPKQCKLPRSDYGSPAILQYYLHQLHEIIHYPALQDVFHCFRELGNAILFFLMIEQSLSQEEIKDLLQAAPFQNLIPRPYAKEGESLEVKIRRLEAKYAAMSLVNIIKKLGTEKQGKLVEEADLLTRERLCIGLTTFEVMLDRIRSFLLDDPIWTNNPSSAISSNISPLSNIDDTYDFHRIWSALQFIYCLPTRHENDMNVEQLYGEGLNFAGCTIIRLLNEHRKFETYDFTYHLFKINRSDQKEDEVKNVSLPTFTERIRKFQILNQQIFACLNKYLCHTTTDEIPVEQVKCLTPMTLQTIQSSIPIYQHNRLPGTTSEC
ncbi:unnamed protein product [Rotaria sp. Silwood2]|nr:unnamed protein product [Rotaria sp. Silwood2]